MLTPYIIPISGRKSRGKNEKFVTNFKILPSRTPGLGICLRHEAIRLVIARSEATWQSRSTQLDNRAVSANTQAIAGDCRVGLRPPRNDKPSAFTVLLTACFLRRCSAGPGCPLPYKTRASGTTFRFPVVLCGVFRYNRKGGTQIVKITLS